MNYRSTRQLAAGYDISASASTSSGSGTGAVKFGNVSIGQVGGSSGGLPTWAWYLIIPAAAFLIWKLFFKKKKS